MTLVTRKLSKEFGGVSAVQDLDMELPPGKITALIGPNGAGKTTIFDLITGFLPPSSGTISWQGDEISGEEPFSIVRAGISRTFQEVKLFRSLTVGQNLLMAIRQRMHEGLFDVFLHRKGIERETKRHLEDIIPFLRSMNLADKLHVPASALSYGQSKLVEILRAILSRPSLLMLDEPVSGLNPVMISTLKQLIVLAVKEMHMTLLVIEHNMPFVFELADHVVVVDHGVKIAEGPPGKVKHDPRVISAYLG